MINRIRKHLNLLGSRKSAINDHFLSCHTCSNLQYHINSLTILSKCHSDYESKIDESLLTKRHSPSLAEQFCAKRALFLLNIY